MQKNKKVKENGMYAVTRSLCDENGEPLRWEFRHISTKENEEIREDCTIEVQVTGKPNVFRPKLKSAEYIRKMIVASVVVPDLYNSDLQDSYGVKKPEDLLLEMVDDPGEYGDLAAFVQKFQGFDVGFAEKVDEAKN